MPVRILQNGLPRFAENHRARQRVPFDVEPGVRPVLAFASLRELLRHIEQNRAGYDLVDQPHFLRPASVE